MLSSRTERDPARVDIPPPSEERDRTQEVSVEAPSEGIWIPLARAFAAAVEDEDAVTVADEHARMLLRSLLAGIDDHRGAVLCGHEPAFELEAVTRVEGDASVRRTEMAAAGFRPCGVREPVRERERKHDEEEDDRCGNAEKEPARVPP